MKKVELDKAKTTEIEVSEPSAGTGSFFSFRYGYRSMTSIGGKTHFKARDVRFEDGKIEAEEIEGTMDESAYNRAAGELQRSFFDQLSSFLRPFLLPFGPRDKK